MRHSIIFVALALAACGADPVADTVRADAPFGLNVAGTENAGAGGPAAATPAASFKYDKVKLAAARADLRKEPKVVDFLLDPSQAVILQVAVIDDGTPRWGFAEYFCLRLRDWGLDNGRSVVRIVDAAKVASSNGSFRSISLGTVQCWDQERWD